MPIQYIGLSKLDDVELAKLKSKSEKLSGKIERKIPNSTIVIIVKTYKKAGSRSKYSIHAKLNSPHTKVVAQTDDWDIVKAIHKIFNKLETEVLNKFKS